MSQAVELTIFNRIYGHGRGWAFSKTDFVMEHPEGRVNQALSSLVKAGKIRRVLRGIYDYPRIEAIPIYPEHRLANHPTTAKIVDRFQDMSVSRLMQDNKLVNEFRDPLNDVQLSVLSLLGMSEADYWKSIK